MDLKDNKNELKKFFIKLVAITIAIIVIINVSLNVFFSDKLDKLNKVFSLGEKENIEILKDKIRLELARGLEKEQLLSNEDKMLLIKFYKKIEKEIKNTETE
tara:strand:+ start:3830 stop:4135 length:306 start_codon:yes stop_codon:yes gene_type:complete